MGLNTWDEMCFTQAESVPSKVPSVPESVRRWEEKNTEDVCIVMHIYFVVYLLFKKPYLMRCSHRRDFVC